MRKLLTIPGFVLLAIGCVYIYLGIIPSHVMGGYVMGFFGSLLAAIGMFLILLSGIFDSVLKKRWGPDEQASEKGAIS